MSSPTPDSPDAPVSPADPVVEPLDEDGVGAVAVGIGLWLVALVVLVVFRERWGVESWWIWVAATGAVLGLPGLWYTTRRRAAYRRAGHE